MKTVLLVDDNLINNLVAKKVISNVDPSWQIWDYTDASKALSALPEINPTIIFLDLNMPVLKGWQFLEGMLAQQLPYQVYILTSSTSELDRHRSTTYGNVKSFLTKPLAPETVAAILQVAESS